MSQSDHDLSYMATAAPGFGAPEAATDWPAGEVANPHPSVTETWWWCFHIAERNLNGEVYFWRHPNLNTTSGGVWVYEGIKKHHLQCEHFNWKNFLPSPQVTEAGLYSPELNLRINVLDPLVKHELLYYDEDTDTSLELLAESLQPPVMRADNMHFEQPQRMSGKLHLNGEDITFDCASMRDRSWGEPRPEVSVVSPPTLWAVGVSGDGSTCFNFNSCDDPERSPLVAEYGLTKEQAFKIGWILRDGRLLRLSAVSKATTRGPDRLQPLRYDCELRDEEGTIYQLTGETKAAVFWSPWPNMAAYFGQLTRWELDGEVMYGEAQEIFWSDSIKRMLENPPG
jgi:hypothetical protein